MAPLIDIQDSAVTQKLNIMKTSTSVCLASKWLLFLGMLQCFGRSEGTNM